MSDSKSCDCYRKRSKSLAVTTCSRPQLGKLSLRSVLRRILYFFRYISSHPTPEQGIVDNETLGYFLVRIYLFLVKIGIDPSRLRFRQHMANEMAHYASDCWDAEIETSYGWIECVGCADRFVVAFGLLSCSVADYLVFSRSAYDLTVHSARTNTKLVVREALKEPVTEERYVPVWDKKKLGPKFGKESKVITDTVEGYDQERLACVAGELANGGKTVIRAANGKDYELTEEFLKVQRKSFTTTGMALTSNFVFFEHAHLISIIRFSFPVREFTPNVIEPSFGIGRILYSLLEHTYWAREEDVARGVLSLPPIVAPIKVLIVPLSGNEEFKPLVKDVCKSPPSGPSS
jgi:glycyl-tRNA synthetase